MFIEKSPTTKRSGGGSGSLGCMTWHEIKRKAAGILARFLHAA